MRILAYILIFFLLVLSSLFWVSNVSASDWINENFETYGADYKLDNISGWDELNDQAWITSDNPDYVSDGSWGVINSGGNNGRYLTYDSSFPISGSSFSFSFDYKFVSSNGYFNLFNFKDLEEYSELRERYNEIHYNTYAQGEWHTIRFDFTWDVGLVAYTSFDTYVDDVLAFSDSEENNGYPSEIFMFRFEILGLYQAGSSLALDNFKMYMPPLPPASINIVSPLAGTELTEDFNIIGNYDLKGEDWDRVVIFFEEWNVLSTCPVFGTEEWWEEFYLGWLHFSSISYFSEDIILSETGDFLIPIQGLTDGNYNCNKCKFFNTELELFSTEKCQGYNLIYGDIIVPDIPPVPVSNWTEYYSSVSEKFPTSTPLFNSITGSFSPIINKMMNFSLFVKEYFDVGEATSRGEDLGGAIPKARGYLEMIDDFIGLPLSGFIIFYILTMAVVISYKIILAIIKLLKP